MNIEEKIEAKMDEVYDKLCEIFTDFIKTFPDNDDDYDAITSLEIVSDAALEAVKNNEND